MEAPFVSYVGSPYLVLGVALGAFAIGAALQTWIGRRYLRTAAAPSGPIVEWELAGSKARLDEILTSWGWRGRAIAGVTLVIDVPFLVAYGVGLSIAASVGSATFDSYGWETVACVFAVVAWLAPAAAVLDLSENLLLGWTLVRGTASNSLALSIRGLAKTKFLLLKASAPIAVGGLILNLLGCRSGCLPA